MKQKIEIGNIVMLKSGGPAMTVNNVNEETMYCKYFNFNPDGTKKCVTVSFNENALNLVNEDAEELIKG